MIAHNLIARVNQIIPNLHHWFEAFKAGIDKVPQADHKFQIARIKVIHHYRQLS